MVVLLVSPAKADDSLVPGYSSPRWKIITPFIKSHKIKSCAITLFQSLAFSPLGGKWCFNIIEKRTIASGSTTVVTDFGMIFVFFKHHDRSDMNKYGLLSSAYMMWINLFVVSSSEQQSVISRFGLFNSLSYLAGYFTQKMVVTQSVRGFSMPFCLLYHRLFSCDLLLEWWTSKMIVLVVKRAQQRLIIMIIGGRIRLFNTVFQIRQFKVRWIAPERMGWIERSLINTLCRVST